MYLSENIINKFFTLYILIILFKIGNLNDKKDIWKLDKKKHIGQGGAGHTSTCYNNSDINQKEYIIKF